MTTVIPTQARPYFRDVYDHTLRINDMIDSVRDLLGTALEAHLSLISVSQNEDTRRLAAWAAIFAVPTAIAGHLRDEFRLHAGAALAVGISPCARADHWPLPDPATCKFKQAKWL